MGSCEHRKVVTGRQRVCIRDVGHDPPHRDADGASWVVGAELDDTGLGDFARYVGEHDIAEGEEAAAFGAWLSEQAGWEGRIERDDS